MLSLVSCLLQNLWDSEVFVCFCDDYCGNFFGVNFLFCDFEIFSQFSGRSQGSIDRRKRGKTFHDNFNFRGRKGSAIISSFSQSIESFSSRAAANRVIFEDAHWLIISTDRAGSRVSPKEFQSSTSKSQMILRFYELTKSKAINQLYDDANVDLSEGLRRISNQ
jgi:hypothetical protein